MNGSHWVATHVKNNIINYFDSFGIPPLQEIVNHAEKTNTTLLHQSGQMQNILSTTCGHFCLYFLNEMNKEKSYFDLLKMFDIYDTLKNDKFIEKYFMKYILYMKSYCVKQKKVSDCVPNFERYMKAKNGRLMLKCTCAECAITKTKFVKNNQLGGDIFSDIANISKQTKDIWKAKRRALTGRGNKLN